MSKDMNVVLLDGMLNKVRADIRRFPRRTVRNLIDLGAKLARGQNQKKFLGDAQDMLENRRSAYYKAVEDMVSHVDLDSLFTFGKNIGYNSCLVGSRKIREIRDEKGYCVPWALSLILDEERLAHSPQDYEKIIKQGVDQGIFTYILFDRGSDVHIKIVHLYYLYGIKSWVKALYPRCMHAIIFSWLWVMTGMCRKIAVF